uniref:(northern house mosquito) hypothetical protein n=1 Tax=Culex pipiens TaxID=7175 RepID=A0A8D8EVX2_CULPI
MRRSFTKTLRTGFCATWRPCSRSSPRWWILLCRRIASSPCAATFMGSFTICSIFSRLMDCHRRPIRTCSTETLSTGDRSRWSASSRCLASSCFTRTTFSCRAEITSRST